MASKTTKILIGVAGTLLIAVIVIQVFFAMAPKKKIKQVQNIVFSDSVYYNKFSAYLEHPELYDMVKEVSFVEAQLDIANSDSIWLMINFPDSTASLRLKGVDLHHTKITKFKVDPFFYGLDPVTYRKLLSEPLNIISDVSTIEKEPIKVKKAPKDTIEYMNSLTAPDTIKYNPAFLIINLDHDIRLILKQTERNTEEEKQMAKKFNSDLYKERIKSNLSSIYKKDYNYLPEIVLEIPTNEIHSIYRALPVNGKVVLTF